MSSVKMIILDLDGTLLRSDKTVSERTLRTLQKCRLSQCQDFVNIVFGLAKAHIYDFCKAENRNLLCCLL